MRPLGKVLKQNLEETNIEGSKKSNMEWPEVKRSHMVSCQHLVSGLLTGMPNVVTGFYMPLQPEKNELLEPTLSHNVSII